MSASYEEIPNVGGTDRFGGQGGGDGDEDEDDDDTAPGDYRIGKKQHTGTGCGFGKANQVVQRQFTKAKKVLRRSRSRRAVLRSSSSWNASTGSGKIISGGDTGNGCYSCCMRPQVLESPNWSPTSDPNDPSFTTAMLKTLIEKNDFYSKECNPHVD